jgi:hypothetical protein
MLCAEPVVRVFGRIFGYFAESMSVADADVAHRSTDATNATDTAANALASSNVLRVDAMQPVQHKAVSQLLALVVGIVGTNVDMVVV